jgi:hypothetical protein
MVVTIIMIMVIVMVMVIVTVIVMLTLAGGGTAVTFVAFCCFLSSAFLCWSAA